ncbi:hypothetical protein PIROE2DRAFT_62858 [Piromyces sp. E2]|nr:hypothetical protein PIROE2DRAFT_62858 [Piromyces sp. E2]|eukprot:OUM60901.1 hypothetical protein PIROE2DRAFT_62858 [Piromyces sp. E2]
MKVSVNSSVHSLKFMNDEIITISEYGKAIHDYLGRAEDELTFEEEDVIYLSLKDETGDWFFGELNGSRGWFPSSNVRILSDRECANEGLAWPPQSSLLNSGSSFSIKSSYKDPSLFSIRNRCNSKDSFSSINSSVNHVTIPTNNEDASNPTLPAPQVRSWFSKYQQIQRYQPKRGLGVTNQSKLGSSALCNPPIAASNLSERIAVSESERKAALANSILPASSNNNSSLNSNTDISSEKPENSLSVPSQDKAKSDGNDNINNDNSENVDEEKKQLDNNKENSDSNMYSDIINEVANILNSDIKSNIFDSDDKVSKEENVNSNDNINTGNTPGSSNEQIKQNESIGDINSNNVNSNNESGSRPQTPLSENSQVTNRSNLTVNVNVDSKKVGHHSAKAIQSASTPTRVIQRVTTPTASRQKWSDLVSSSTIENLSKKEIQRQEVMFEMINTEKDYLKDLKIVMENCFELVHTGKQSYRIAVDTQMNKEVWLKMLNNVILNDVQSNKVDSVTSMKPSVETTYRSLNGKKNLKNISPKTPDYRIATLKFGDASMIKEVEQEFNRLNSQSFMSDTDDEKSIASTDVDESTLTPINSHYGVQEMPSINEDVTSNVNEINNTSTTSNGDIDNNLTTTTSEDKTEKEEKTEEKSDEIKENNEICEKKNEEEKEEEEEEDEEKGSPLPTVTVNVDDDVFKLSVKRGSHSLDFEGIKDFYNNDESNSTKDPRKRFSFPLSAIQSHNINVNDEAFKNKYENTAISETSIVSHKTTSPVGLSDSSIKENDEHDESNSKDDQQPIDVNDKEQGKQKDESKNSNEVNVLDDKDMIVPLNDMLEEGKNNNEINDNNNEEEEEEEEDILLNNNNNEEKEEEEEEVEEDILPNNKFANVIKSYDSLEHIKNYVGDDGDENQCKSESKSFNENNKSNESVNLPTSSSNGSLVINNIDKEDDSVNNSVDALDVQSDKNNETPEDFSFSKLRNMFGEISNKNNTSDLSSKNSSEQNARREELKNIILPAKIRHTNDTRRGLMISTIMDDNKNSQVDSPTRLIYDISKNPFIIKDMSSHKTKLNNSKTTNDDFKSSMFIFKSLY